MSITLSCKASKRVSPQSEACQLVADVVDDQTEQPDVDERLIDAVRKREINIVIDCIEQGARAHVDSRELVVLCAKRGFEDILAVLLENGAEAEDDTGSLLVIAVQMKNVRVLKLLVSHGGQIVGHQEALLKAARDKCAVECWRYLYEQGCSPMVLGWQYFATVMGPPLMLRGYLKKKINSDFRQYIEQYSANYSSSLDD